MQEIAYSQPTESGAPHMYQLYSMVIDRGSLGALQELSSMAMGGSESPIGGRARQLVDRIDGAVSAGELALLPDEKPSPLVPDSVFLLIHPINTLRTVRRQFVVGLGTEGPPAGHTIEGFSELPLARASRAIWAARPPKDRGGVPLSSWSESDQELLQRGERPEKYPDHPNI